MTTLFPTLFPRLPMFMDLAGRSAVLLSGAAELSALAARLVDAGASVTVFDPTPSSGMEAVSGARLVRRRWRSADLKGATLVVAGAADRRALRARAAAKAARAVFYAPGAPDVSDIAFGADLAFGPLSIGIGGAGIDPGLEEAVRARIAAAMPEGFAGFLAAAQSCAGVVDTAIPDAADRSRFWRETASAAFARSNLAGQAGWEAWISERIRESLQGEAVAGMSQCSHVH